MVCGKHDGTLLSVSQEKVPYLTSCVRVHARRRFIQDNCLGVTDKSKQDGELAFHATGEVLGEFGDVRRQVDTREEAVCVCVCVRVCVCVCACA